MVTSADAQGSEQIVIRDIETPSEIRAAERLQKEVWGLPDLDVVPSTQLTAAKAAGGVLIGAFDGDELIGFVYGFPGYENGRATHHSHMLAVDTRYRNFGLGYKLKLAQRDFVLALGITEMTWTFDPLQSLNAHFNFERLGVISDRYLIDFYGTDAASFLHQNGTDRLWVTWLLASERVVDRLGNASAAEFERDGIRLLVRIGENNSPISYDVDMTSADDDLAIEIPADVRSIEKLDPRSATAWRTATRKAFTSAFTAGYVALEFERSQKLGRYILRRKTAKGLPH